MDEGPAFAVGRKLTCCGILQTLYDSLPLVKKLVLQLSKVWGTYGFT
jgi:hypothetical protein